MGRNVAKHCKRITGICAGCGYHRRKKEIEKYRKENNQELIVVLSTFDTDEKGGDGGIQS